MLLLLWFVCSGDLPLKYLVFTTSSSVRRLSLSDHISTKWLRTPSIRYITTMDLNGTGQLVWFDSTGYILYRTPISDASPLTGQVMLAQIASPSSGNAAIGLAADDQLESVYWTQMNHSMRRLVLNGSSVPEVVVSGDSSTYPHAVAISSSSR